MGGAHAEQRGCQSFSFRLAVCDSAAFSAVIQLVSLGPVEVATVRYHYFNRSSVLRVLGPGRCPTQQSSLWTVSKKSAHRSFTTLGAEVSKDPCQKEPRSQFAIAGAKPNSVTRSPASELRTSALRMQPGSSSRMSTALFICTKTRRCRIRRLRGVANVSGYTSGLKLRRSVLGFSRSNFSSSLHVSLDKFRP